MKHVLLLFVLSFSLPHLTAQEAASPSERQARALQVATTTKYSNIILQDAESAAAPDGALFKNWLLMEVNNNSLLRDQIAEDVDGIETNGRNSNLLESYFTSDGEYLGRLVFDTKDVQVTRMAGGKGVFTYQASLLAKDNFRGGTNEIDFVFSFKVKVEPFEVTKAHQITVVSYPRFVKKNEKEVENR